MNDKVFSPLATLHLEYRGTGTLTVVNAVGSDFDAAKTWSPSGGTIVQVDEVTITVTAKNFNTGAVIPSARVYLTAAAGGPETLGAVLLTGATNGSGILTGAYRYTSDQPIAGRVRQATGSFFKTADISATITQNGVSLTMLMVPDA